MLRAAAILRPLCHSSRSSVEQPLPADDLSSGRPIPNAAVITISPVKLPIPPDQSDLETPLVGALAIRALELGLDEKNHCLFPLEEELI